METVVESTPLARFAQGDLDAFETLFREHQQEVYRWIVRIVRDPSVAEELTIETFWRVHKAHEHFDPTRSFEAWIRRIGTNVALGYLKRAPVETAALVEPPAPPSADSAEQRDTNRHVRRAFASLPLKLRIPALLAMVEERSHREIAEALNITEKAVKARIFRATQLLRKKLTQMGITP